MLERIPAVVLTGALIALAVPQGAVSEELTIYTTTAPEALDEYAARFNAEHPDIEIKWIRDSTGVIGARVLAEGANSTADLIHVLAVSEIIGLDEADMLEPYKPEGYDEIAARFKDKHKPPHWTGLFLLDAVVCFNTVEAERRGLPQPESWQDLADPVYKGMIVMPDPNSSGTGFMTVSAWLQTMGDSAWSFIDQVHENVAVYVHSGSQPCTMAGTGEFPVGISFGYRGASEKGKGAPIELIYPSEGIGWDLNGAAILKSTDSPEAAKKFMDWAISEDAFRLYAQDYAVVTRPEFASPIENYPEGTLESLAENDLYWATENRSQILEEWQRRYSSKSAPKN